MNHLVYRNMRRHMERERKNRKVKNIIYFITSVVLVAFFVFCMLVVSGYKTYANEPEGFIYYSEIPMSRDLQAHLYRQCKIRGIEYAFALGTIEQESHFVTDVVSDFNDNGSYDIGICQVNSGNLPKLLEAGYIQSYDDIYDPYINIECGMYYLGMCVEAFGNTESAYYYYNTGHRRHGSNAVTRKVMEYTYKWRRELNKWQM